MAQGRRIAGSLSQKTDYLVPAAKLGTRCDKVVQLSMVTVNGGGLLELFEME